MAAVEIPWTSTRAKNVSWGPDKRTFFRIVCLALIPDNPSTSPNCLANFFNAAIVPIPNI